MQIDPVELPNLEGSEMQPESKEQIRQQRVPIPGSLVPGDVANDTRGYVERFVEQVNGCYREGWYDASAIMIRRLLRRPMKSSTCSGHAVHSSERSDASKIIILQVVGMGKGDSILRRDSPFRVSRYAL